MISSIGKATSLADRVGQYYDTPLGHRSPRAGGAWLKTVAGLSELTVHWALSTTWALNETLLLAAFAQSVAPLATYPDKDPVLPWANLEATIDGRRRRHELRGATPLRRAQPD